MAIDRSRILDRYKNSIIQVTRQGAKAHNLQSDKGRQCVRCNGIHCVAQNLVEAFLPASALNELVVDKFSFLFREIYILT